MARKRLVIEVADEDHAALMKRARDGGMTAANYIRQMLNLPLQKQGVKTIRPAVAKKPSKRPQKGA